MTDREKLIELLQYGMDKYFLLKFEAEIFADLLIANGVTVQQWISVEDEKPEEGGTYIVAALDGHTKRVTFAKWQNRIGVWLLTGARSYWRVTHWMPMPDPPKED